jgi:hypothetical protein
MDWQQKEAYKYSELIDGILQKKDQKLFYLFSKTMVRKYKKITNEFESFPKKL